MLQVVFSPSLPCFLVIVLDLSGSSALSISSFSRALVKLSVSLSLSLGKTCAVVTKFIQPWIVTDSSAVDTHLCFFLSSFLFPFLKKAFSSTLLPWREFVSETLVVTSLVLAKEEEKTTTWMELDDVLKQSGEWMHLSLYLRWLSSISLESLSLYRERI